MTLESLVKNFLPLMAVVILPCCHSRSDDPQESRAHISYFDRNGDGRVDLEKHQHPGMADADWELRDDNYDGRYEKKVLYGIAVTESAVDHAIPIHVKIKSTP